MVVGLVQKGVEREIGDREFSFALLSQRLAASFLAVGGLSRAVVLVAQIS